MTRLLNSGVSALALSLLVAVGAFSLPMTASAQTAPGTAADDGATPTEVYSPEYFEQFSPQTASDMVAQIPGFEIRGSSDGERGFGQASLNILINGRRPSSKSSGANEILSRIPASNVERIEIVKGESLDIPGLSGQVANIVAKSGELSGSWNAAARFEEGSQPQLGDIGLNFSAKRGNIQAVGSVGHSQFIFSENGDEQFFDGEGLQTQDRTERLSFDTQNPFANLNLTLNRDNGHIANLNLSATKQNRNTLVQEQFVNLINPAGTGASVAAVTQDQINYEIGGDYDLGLDLLGNSGRLKLIALHRSEDADFISSFLFDDTAPGQALQLFDQNNVSKEYIGRGEYTWKSAQGHDWAFSVEGAINTFDSVSDFSLNDALLVEDDVRVEEDRFQTNLSRSWAVNPRTTLQTSLGAEYSVIDVVSEDGDAGKFFRPKGFITVSRKLDSAWTLRGQVERSVSQLDFGDFISTVSLAEETETQGGNVKPEQKWEFEAELIKQAPKGLSGRFKLFYDIVEDPIEQVLFEGGAQGPANLDSNGAVYGAEANLTWVLDDAVKGLRLTGEFFLSESEIDDPITGTSRNISNWPLWEYDLGFRYDIPNSPFAIEGEVEQSDSAKSFRIDETVENNFLDPEVELAFIHKDLFGMQFTVRVQNIADFRLQRERLRFTPTRTGTQFERQITERQRGQRISFELTDTF